MPHVLAEADAKAISGQFAGAAQAFESSLTTLPLLVGITVLRSLWF